MGPTDHSCTQPRGARTGSGSRPACNARFVATMDPRTASSGSRPERPSRSSRAVISASTEGRCPTCALRTLRARFVDSTCTPRHPASQRSSPAAVSAMDIAHRLARARSPLPAAMKVSEVALMGSPAFAAASRCSRASSTSPRCIQRRCPRSRRAEMSPGARLRRLRSLRSTRDSSSSSNPGASVLRGAPPQPAAMYESEAASSHLAPRVLRRVIVLLPSRRPFAAARQSPRGRP